MMMSLFDAFPQLSFASQTSNLRNTQSQVLSSKLSGGRAREPHTRDSCFKFSRGSTEAKSRVSVNRILKFSGSSNAIRKINDVAVNSTTFSPGSKRCAWLRRPSSRDGLLDDYGVVQCVGQRLLESRPDVDQESSVYHRFVEHAIEQSSQHMLLTPFPMKTKYQELVAKDGKAVTNSFAFQSEKIRQFRAAEINGGRSIQVLNLLVFPSVPYDLPIFCADLVTFAKTHLIVLDLNPLHNADMPRQYKEKYISPLSPLWKKYQELLPWGGELTKEAAEFFSPYVLWSKPIKEQSVDDIVFDAFKDYFNAWLDMVDKAEASNHIDEIYKNQEAQHRYMSWRSTKDPGRNLLTKLYGETLCENRAMDMKTNVRFRSMEFPGITSLEEYMKEFLFAELENMGTKSFLDYFPQYRDQNGSIQKQRSMAGKAYSTRPWDENGNRISAPSA